MAVAPLQRFRVVEIVGPDGSVKSKQGRLTEVTEAAEDAEA